MQEVAFYEKKIRALEKEDDPCSQPSDHPFRKLRKGAAEHEKSSRSSEHIHTAGTKNLRGKKRSPFPQSASVLPIEGAAGCKAVQVSPNGREKLRRKEAPEEKK